MIMYRFRFITYNNIDVDESEAKDVDEAFEIAQRRFLNECHVLWDEYDMEEVEE